MAVIIKSKTKAVSMKAKRVPRLRIRMYRHGLGDCLLLRFARPNTDDTFNVLIDCGLIMVAQNAKETMSSVAEDILTTCGRLDVVAMTHEHWDHASGFSTQQARDVFADIEVGEVWYAWTEDPQNKLGKRLRKERAEMVSAVAMAAAALGNMKANPLAISRAKSLGAILGFFGMDLAAAKSAKGTTAAVGKTRDAFEYLMKRRGIKTRYCYPDKAPIALGDVENVRVFVLGPPEDEAMIKKSTPTKSGREVYELAAEANLAANVSAAFSRLRGGVGATAEADDCPFDSALRKRPEELSSPAPGLTAMHDSVWNASGMEWRKIEHDWTQVAETLALNLDTHTNNTCLVLAFEFIDTGEVFLFPADAQIGNWLSWQQCKWKVQSPVGVAEVSGPELLSRTVFYKVGHHGSHNATLRSHGLEQMISDDLVAFIPVFKDQAMKNRWAGMPFPPLIKRLQEKTGGRLLRSDEDTPKKDDLSSYLSEKTKSEFLSAIKTTTLYFEYSYG